MVDGQDGDAAERQRFLETHPIPTYDEATSSRPAGSGFLGPSEVSHDAERQGLLGSNEGSQPSSYRRPTVESDRTSLDMISSGRPSRDSDDHLRTELEQMEVDDSAHRGPTGFSKHITTLTHSLSSIHLPFREYLPSADYIRAHLPQFPIMTYAPKPGWLLFVRFTGFVIVVSVVYILFLSNIFSFRGQNGLGQIYNPETMREFAQSHIDEKYISENLEYITKFDHIAGTKGNFILAEFVRDRMIEAGLEQADLERFDVFLNYPTPDGRRIAIVDPPELAWEATLEEERAYTDPPREQTLSFHGNSRTGNVTGPLIYANYGSREDFKILLEHGISLNGSIALVRYYGSQGDRALKIKAAELAGCAGCIIYSDPAEDGFVKGAAYPDGRYRPADGVQRGGVSLMSFVVGDVLSPGFASLPGEKKRISKDSNPGLNNIPSLPIAWRDAQKLLQSLKGKGQTLHKSVGWIGGVPDVEWWTGSLEESPKVNLMNFQDDVERQPIYNVIGKITGFEQSRKSIIVGNHRDAWCFGAVDPGSGTAVFLEIVRVFGELKKAGWRPLRTIEFMSWDAEEYNLVGSTEHVEARIEDLRRDGFAYINVDVAVLGDDLGAAGSPLLERAFLRAIDRVADPVLNETLLSIWQGKNKVFGGLGAGSDYVAFQDLAGTSSIDFGFGGPEYPYHSCYDNFDWMTKYGDPGFLYHKALGQVWALLILELADELLLPFDLNDYAHAVQGYVKELDTYISKAGAVTSAIRDGRPNVNLDKLYAAAKQMGKATTDFHKWDEDWAAMVRGVGGVETEGLTMRRMDRNSRAARFETDLLDLEKGGGLPGREQFKHVIFAPQAWSGYDEAYFPGIRDAVDEGDWKLAQKQADKVARIIERACKRLNE
ncbi:hypothetical protein MMC25_006039 [Agyrium rufum]|nr:hypothetical protein [Agyrium rufum]